MGARNSVAGLAGPGSYWDWQRRLEEAFLWPRSKPEPFVLFLDEDEARRLWPSEPDPAGDLASAVNSRLDWAAGRRLLRPLEFEFRRWQRGDRHTPPPSLPILAVTVLAASRMQRDAEASSSAYFLRLAQILRPEASRQHQEELRQQLSMSFDPVAAMWRSLHEWVRNREATVGVSTIREDPHFTRIGFALSQAIIKRSDRMRLTALFAALDISDGDIPAPAALLRYLRIWASRSRGLSQQFCRTLHDRHASGMLQEHVYRLAAAWDGKVLTHEGHRRLEFRFTINLDEYSTSWVIPLAHGVDEDELHIEGGGKVRVCRPEYGSFYRVEGILPPVSEGLAKGLRATGKLCAAAVEPQPLIALRQDVSVGAWISVAGLQPFENHLLVVQPRLREELENALSIAAEPGWRLLPQRAPHVLLPGKLVYRGVRLSNPETFEQAAEVLGPALAQGLRPDPGSRPRLSGGLPLARHLSRGHYLVGGAPDLVLPVGVEPRHVEAALNAVRQTPSFRATGFPIALRRLGLEEGRYELNVDGEILVFHLHEALQTELAPRGQDLGWRADDGYRLLNGGSLQRADISGAAIPGTRPDPLQLRRNAETWLVDRYGRAARTPVPASAASFTERGVPDPYYVTVEPGPDCAWLVEIRNGRPKPPLLLRWQEPSFADIDEDSARLWRQLGEAGAAGDRLLELYLRAWRRWAG